MFDIRVEVRSDRTDYMLSRLSPTIQNKMDKFLTAFSVRLLNQIQMNIVRLFNSTGRLFNSVYVTRRENLIVASVRDVPYARILEEGGVTSPHVIVPRVASVLAFEGPDGLVFAKRVNHPGSRIPARPYVSLALTQLRGEFEGGIREIVAEAKGEL